MRHSTLAIITLLGVALVAGGCTGKSTRGEQARQQAHMHQAALKSGIEWTMAQQAFEVGDLDTALKRVRTSISLNDRVPKAHVLHGRILLERGNLEGAINAFHTALDIDPNHAEGYYAAGVAYERMSKDDLACLSYYQAYELDNNDAQALIAAIETSINAGDLEQAKEWVQKGLSQMRHNAALHQLLGQISLLRGDYPAAIASLEEASLLSPEDAAIQEDLTRAMFEAGRYAECEHRVQRLLRDPAYAGRRDLRHMRADSLVRLDRGFEARDILMGLVSEDPTDTRAWVSLGKVAYTLGDDRRLRQAADRLIGLEPNSPEGFILRALWEWDHGDKERALRMLQRATTLRSDDVHALRLSAVWLHQLGQHEEAMETLIAVRTLTEESANRATAQTAVPSND